MLDKPRPPLRTYLHAAPHGTDAISPFSTLLTRHGEFSLDVLKQTAGPRSNRVQQFVMQQRGTEAIDEVEITFARIPEAAIQDIVRKLKTLTSVTEVETP